MKNICFILLLLCFGIRSFPLKSSEVLDGHLSISGGPLGAMARHSFSLIRAKALFPEKTKYLTSLSNEYVFLILFIHFESSYGTMFAHDVPWNSLTNSVTLFLNNGTTIESVPVRRSFFNKILFQDMPGNNGSYSSALRVSRGKPYFPIIYMTADNIAVIRRLPTFKFVAFRSKFSWSDVSYARLNIDGYSVELSTIIPYNSTDSLQSGYASSKFFFKCVNDGGIFIKVERSSHFYYLGTPSWGLSNEEGKDEAFVDKCPVVKGAIRSKKNIKKGSIYKKYGKEGEEFVFEFLGDIGSGEFSFEYKSGFRKNYSSLVGMKGNAFYTDFGIEPYLEPLTWSKYNYVRKVN